jgi:acetolactate synthase I/II/III large subunit
VGDARQALEGLHEHLAALAPDAGRLAAWWSRIDAWRAEHPPREARHPEGAVDAEATLDALQDTTGGNAIVTTDVGQHQMWAANRLRFDLPRRWLTSGGLGTMGFGLPAAIGAQVAFPAAQVVCVTGDGSLLMNVSELATAVEEELPVKVLLLDNEAYGMVRQQQDLFWDGRRTASALGGALDWELVARGFGLAARSVSDGEDVPDALHETLAEDGPALLHVAIERDADCLPMFRPGGPAREMMG